VLGPRYSDRTASHIQTARAKKQAALGVAPTIFFQGSFTHEKPICKSSPTTSPAHIPQNYLTAKNSRIFMLKNQPNSQALRHRSGESLLW
jgi:hypothetical protein